jgi:hypothetical protein
VQDYANPQPQVPHSAPLAALIGPYDQIIDPSGDAADNYLTATSISTMLAAVQRDASEAPLVSQLSQPWTASLPERTTLAGYASGPRGQSFAYTVIINGQLYNAAPDLPSRFEPAISRVRRVLGTLDPPQDGAPVA